MDKLTIVLVILAAGCVAWYTVSTILIFNELRKRGQKASFLFLNIMAPIYAYRYKAVTIKETGRAGRLFYSWVVSINLTLLLALLAIISHKY